MSLSLKGLGSFLVEETSTAERRFISLSDVLTLQDKLEMRLASKQNKKLHKAISVNLQSAAQWMNNIILSYQLILILLK